MLKTICAALAIGCLMPAVVGAAVSANFSGGGGTPITFALPAAVSYTVTDADTGAGFLFKGAAPNNPFALTPTSATGTMTYSINGGPSFPLTTMNSGFAANDQAAADLLIFGTFTPLSLGDVVVLSFGNLATTANIAAAAPPSGSFTTFLIGGDLNRLSTNGVAVPEPTALGLAGLGAMGLTARRRRIISG